MAGSSSVLREFLVKIGFKVDEQQYRNFQNNLQNITKSALEVSKAFVKTGEAVGVAMTGVGLALHSVAKGMEGVYYSSQRTGASAKELGALEYAFQQIGLSAEDARGSVEALAAARRSQPGLDGALAGLGITAGADNARVYVQLLEKMRNMAPYLRNQYAALFHLDGETINQVENNGPAFLQGIRDREQMYRQDGYDPDEAAKKAVEFDRTWNKASSHFEDLSKILALKLMPIAERLIVFLGKVADMFTVVDKATGGWSTNIIALVAALTPLLGALKFLGGFKAISTAAKALGGLLGGGGGAVAAEGAGAIAGEGVAGAGVLALLPELLPFIIAAVAVSAIAWMVMHPQQVGKAAAWVGHKAQEAGHAIASGTVKAAHWVMSGITSMTAHFEGYRDKVYKDIAGHQTIFYGHLLRAGETVQGLMKEGPAAVLARDLKDAAASVAKLVKVHLSNNQAQALSDLVFNVGAQKFAHSTLLRKLNSGDYAGAADQFQYWNKALVNGHMTAVQGLTNRRASEANLFRTGDKPVTISQKSDFHISSTDPQGAASEVDRRQRAANADLVRNFAGAIQ